MIVQERRRARQDHSGHAPYFLHPVQLRAGVCIGRFLYCGKQSGALKLYNGSAAGTECLRCLPDDHGAVVRKAFVRGLGQVLADQAGGKGVTPAVKGTLVWFKELENFCLRYEYRADTQRGRGDRKDWQSAADRATIARLLKETSDLSRRTKSAD